MSSYAEGDGLDMVKNLLISEEKSEGPLGATDLDGKCLKRSQSLYNSSRDINFKLLGGLDALIIRQEKYHRHFERQWAHMNGGPVASCRFSARAKAASPSV